MTNLTRRNFLKQLALLPMAAVLPALPEIAKPSLAGRDAAVWFNGELINCEPDWAFVETCSPSLEFAKIGRSVFDGLIEGLNHPIFDRVVSYEVTVFDGSDLEGPAPSWEWFANCLDDDEWWAAQETYWGREI